MLGIATSNCLSELPDGKVLREIMSMNEMREHENNLDLLTTLNNNNDILYQLTKYYNQVTQNRKHTNSTKQSPTPQKDSTKYLRMYLDSRLCWIIQLQKKL